MRAPGQKAVEHGAIDEVATPGARAAEERHEHRRQACQPGGKVATGNAGDDGHAIAAIIDRKEPGHRLYGQIVRGMMRERARLAKGADGAIDDAGIARGDHFIAEAEALHHAGAKPFHQDIGRVDQRPECVAARVRLQVEATAILAPIEAAKPDRLVALKGRLVARRVAAGRFDLDHFSSLIRHHHGQHGAGQEQRQVDDPDPRQFGHGARSVMVSDDSLGAGCDRTHTGAGGKWRRRRDSNSR